MRINIASMVLVCFLGGMLLSACKEKIDVDSLTAEQAHALTPDQLKSLTPQERVKVQQRAAFFVDPKRDFSSSDKPLPR
ncbi:MAG: hypothetical protein P4L42_14010 [Desulfocapsaceae bacterium]|nr:hypothetical protein [Desulfocapsaceae bacterium]